MKLRALQVKLIQRWQQFTGREQLWLLACGASLLVYLLWAAIVQPLNAARELSERRLTEARQQVLAVQSLAQELIELRDERQLGTAMVSLPQFLDDAASATGLRVSTLEPAIDGQSATIRMEQVPMNNLLQWLSAVEAGGRNRVESMTIVPSAATGLSVNVTVRGR